MLPHRVAYDNCAIGLLASERSQGTYIYSLT